MIIVCIRTFILYAIVLFALRIMGKSELSKLSTFQMVVLFMIAELASIPIDSPTASLVSGVMAIFTLLFLQVLLSYLSIKSEKVKTFINGRPSILIENGMINIKEMSRLRITINDLFEQLRIGNCPSITDVEYAVMESNGQLSIIAKTDQEKLPLVVVSDGMIYEDNMRKAGIDYDTLLCLIEAKGIKDISNVFLAFYDGTEIFHVYPMPQTKQKFTGEVF